jgi:protein O-GlcNAc transferase
MSRAAATKALALRAEKLLRRGAYATAIPVLRRAFGSDEHDVEIRFYLAGCYFKLGEIEAAIREWTRVAGAVNTEFRRAALRKIAAVIPGDPRAGNREILRARRQWAALEEKLESASAGDRLGLRIYRRSRGKKLRVGYVCAFFGDRNWMKPVWGMLNAHDRGAFEIHLFVDGGLPKKSYGYVRHRQDRIHKLDRLSNQAATKCVSRAGIDVLVDLNSYSFPSRCGVFVRRPAAVQVAWFNNYATSGFTKVDYSIGDRVVIPASEERLYSERILRVDGTYLAYSVLYPTPRVVRPPCLRDTRITFGCLAPQYKLVNEVVEALTRILRGAPNARLILKNNCLGDAGNRAAVVARFRRKGISAKQLICEGPAEHFKFLKTYDRIDIALDTFPYNGGTTTMEALWQGVPVLTFPGDRWVSRIGASLLRAAGLEEWVCGSRGAFIRRAVQLAKSPETGAVLSALRANMREKLRTAPICDAAGLCRELEQHYQAIGRKIGRRSSQMFVSRSRRVREIYTVK